MPGVGVVFDAAPPLKYAQVLALESPSGSTVATTCAAFMRTFDRMWALHLCFGDDVFSQFNWTFLRQESSSLQGIQFFKDLFLEPAAHIIITAPTTTTAEYVPHLWKLGLS